jgi:hypothetical protein
MRTDLITLLLPIAWASVATVIGLVLYRSSKALIQSVTTSEAKKRTIRLTGSVAIAALAFFAMKWATPAQRLTTTNAVIRGDLDRLQRSYLEAEAALAVNDIPACRTAVTEMGHVATQLRSELLPEEDTPRKDK